MPRNFLDRTIMKPFVVLVPDYIRPNFITAFRLVSVPFVAWLLLTDQYILGLILFVISAFSDALDGALARTRKEVTELGKILDPIADKLLIVTTAFILIGQFLPLWLFYIILAVESLIVFFAILAKYVRRVDVQANIFGKIKMGLETAGVSLLLIYAAVWPTIHLVVLAFWLLLAGVFFGLVSLLYNKNI